MLNWWLGRVQKKNIFDIFLIKKMGCFELFLLAQKVNGDDHIFITWMCCSDVEVIVSMYFIFLANPIWSGTLHHWSQFYREQRRRLLHWETVWCPLKPARCRCGWFDIYGMVYCLNLHRWARSFIVMGSI